MAAAAKAASSAAGAANGFVPRAVFEVSASITRSYFLGHHTAALTSMRKVLSNIGLILECRDSRVPLTSTNPLLESSLASRDRIIVYTKSDLCAPATSTRWLARQQSLLTEWHQNSPSSGSGVIGGRTEVVFTDERNPRSIQRLLALVKERAAAQDSLLGLRALVVGMPNAGKSTLLNALRRVGMRLPGAARTGAQPGVTRKLSTPVRIVAATETSDGAYNDAQDVGEGVFVVDTPGVFVPYVSDLESMLKLSLVGCVKDGLVPAETIADYMLFLINQRDPTIYADLSAPTNDVQEFLDAVAVRTGKLLKGGVPAREHAADWVVQQWRRGHLGRFGLDDISEEGLKARATRLALEQNEGDAPLSLSQARKREKEARKARSLAKRAAALDPTS
ncbi:P-loop containing nucleoside triphosphate hydrolase protein [Xylaria bambusicola]|uniref:P-loop containing nucleoside triphosphate hydrolase protein n=1 Tax=Xylaria bambusicola TaxID=326684 RepID=UPI002007F878|nr:P-loop containing nucleoside triphosphate hydrolase protein [Xylaria bambusicola]KAI0509567.1 P-loop containing nucleoside triphosphate hydrolase protein [Xylaria bambusicola]